MNTSKCPLCGGNMKRNGRAKAGAQRWRCTSCNASTTHRHDNTAKLLKEFLDWLLSRDLQTDMPGKGRTFRLKTAKFWDIWPMPPWIDEIHRVVYVDGIYLSRKVCILIARSDGYVLGWYLARTENSRAWEALLSRIAPPKMVVTDGGSGFEKARRRVWKDTSVQRCIFHAFCQARRYTTTRPNLPAGVELYGLAKDILHIKDLKSAELWVERYLTWCTDWDGFLSEKTYTDDHHWVWTHERLVKAKNSLNILINKGTLFTYLDPVLSEDGPLPPFNNMIEGGVMAPLRQLLRDHRGMSLMRRIKAVFWWCYMHTECPASLAELLKTMPTDKDIDQLYRSSTQTKEQDGPQRWGDGIMWSEFHNSGPYHTDWD